MNAPDVKTVPRLHSVQVDEVECLWQTLINSRPNLPFLQVDWDKHLSAPDLLTIARFIKYPEPDVARVEALMLQAISDNKVCFLFSPPAEDSYACGIVHNSTVRFPYYSEQLHSFKSKPNSQSKSSKIFLFQF